MDFKKEFDDFQSSMKNFNINVASEILSNCSFNLQYAGEVVEILGQGLTNSNFKSRPDYFIFCEEQLLKFANNEEYQEVIFDFLDIIEMDDSKLSSSVLIVVTVFENTKNPIRAALEYLLISTFDILYTMDITDLKDILLCIIQLLGKLKKHFLHQQSISYHFARVAFLVLNANIEPNEYLNFMSNVIYDPFYLLEFEFDEKEEKLSMASFFYLYFKTGMEWGPKIYNQSYVLEKCCNLAMSVYDNNNFAKDFVKLILTKFKNNGIPLHSLNKYHENFLLEAAHCSVYNNSLNVRKDSLESMLIFLDKLSSDAQYVVLKYAFLKPLEPCIKDQLIIKMKNLISLNLKSNNVLGYFQGIRLLEIIRLCCNIPDKPGFYVQNNKEHILGAITLMHFLSANNIEKLNMGEAFLNEAKQFVDTIQKAIDYSHEQHNLELKDLDNKVVKKENDIETCNLNFSKLSENDKREVLSQMNITTLLVQSNLDLLKSIIKK